jgi:hypothetical protein
MLVAPWLLSTALVLGTLAGIAGTTALSPVASAADAHRRLATGHTKSRRNPAATQGESGVASPSDVPATPPSGQRGAASGSAGGGSAGGAPAASGGQSLSSPDALKLCLDSWDTGTGMSKKEWRDTCVRTLKEYPPLNAIP